MPIPWLVAGAVGAVVGAVVKNRKHKREISKRDSYIDDQEDQIDEQRSQLSRKDEQIALLKKQIAMLEDALSKSTAREASLRLKLERLEEERTEIVDKLEKLFLEVQKLEDEKELLSVRVHMLEAESKRFVNKLLLRAGNIRREAGKLEMERLLKVNEHRHAGSQAQLHEKKVIELEKHRKNASAELDETIKEIQDMNKQRSELQKKLSGL
jgi:chromosome segregation ATPase